MTGIRKLIKKNIIEHELAEVKKSKSLIDFFKEITYEYKSLKKKKQSEYDRKSRLAYLIIKTKFFIKNFGHILTEEQQKTFDEIISDSGLKNDDIDQVLVSVAKLLSIPKREPLSIPEKEPLPPPEKEPLPPPEKEPLPPPEREPLPPPIPKAKKKAVIESNVLITAAIVSFFTASLYAYKKGIRKPADFINFIKYKLLGRYEHLDKTELEELVDFLYEKLMITLSMNDYINEKKKLLQKYHPNKQKLIKDRLRLRLLLDRSFYSKKQQKNEIITKNEIDDVSMALYKRMILFRNNLYQSVEKKRSGKKGCHSSSLCCQAEAGFDHGLNHHLWDAAHGIEHISRIRIKSSYGYHSGGWFDSHNFTHFVYHPHYLQFYGPS